MRFPDGLQHSCPWCYLYHVGTSVIVSGGFGMQQCMIRNHNEMHKLSKFKNGHNYAPNNKQW